MTPDASIGLPITNDLYCRILESVDAATIRDGRNYLAAIARRLMIDDARRAKAEAAFRRAPRVDG